MRLFRSPFEGVILSVAKDPDDLPLPQPLVAFKPKSSWFRFAQLILVAALACTTLAATNRFDDLNHKLMCTCGCSQLLGECNHVGCPDSPGELADLHAQMDNGLGDRPILNYFATKYGPTVLAAPMRGGFDNVAWIVPFAALALAIFGVALLIRKWRVKTVAAPSAAANAPFDPMRDRIRKETEY
jgi:cytochrome c-type biogenesis protein CcmH